MADGTIRRLAGGEAPSLAAVERHRRHLWIVAGVFLVAASIAVVLALTDAELVDVLPETPALRWGFLVLSVAFLLYVGDQERRLRRLTHLLVHQEVLTASLESRIADLTRLSRVGRLVNSVLSIEEVLQVVLEAAFEVTRAHTGSVMLREGDHLRVAVSTGPAAAPVGATTGLGNGVAGWVAQRREPLLLGGDLAAEQLPGVEPRGRRRGSAIVAPLIAGGELVGVLSLERPSGEQPFRDLELRSVALFAEHAATAVRNAERYEHERRTSAELADTMQLRSEFVATVVHDLKSPLTAIVGFANMVRHRWDLLSPDQRDMAMEQIQEQGRRLYDLADEVLRSASVEAGATLAREPVDVEPLLREVAGTVAAAAGANDGVERPVEVAVVGDVEPASGDREALRHVFTNLLENAAKFSPPGSPVEVELRREGDHVAVDVTDHGPGISEEDQPHVFERFAFGRHREAGATGVGLGLYIVRTLVEAHGGQVGVHSVVGEGATFSVRLPLTEEPPPSAPPPAPERPVSVR